MQQYLIEFIATAFFIYVFLATGNPLAIGAALALALILVQNFAKGGLNPAVAITMAAAGKLPTTELVPYCVAQLLGGLVALEIYKRYA